jgi:hypothetical protein
MANHISPTSNARLQISETRLPSAGARNRLNILIDEIRGTGELAVRYRNLLVEWANETRLIDEIRGTSELAIRHRNLLIEWANEARLIDETTDTDTPPVSTQIVETWDQHEGYSTVIPAGTMAGQEINRHRIVCAMAYWAVTGIIPTLTPGAGAFAITLLDPIRAAQIRRSTNPDPAIVNLHALIEAIRQAAVGKVDPYTFARSLFGMITLDPAPGELRPYLAEIAFVQMLLG